MTSEGNREPDDEDVLRREEDAAAAEAGGIGGRRPDYDADEAHRPLEESGEGEEEGFEEAERELIEAASHGESRVDPEDDAFPSEEDALDATPDYGEADEEELPDT
jgi:hypothetical protein